MNSALTDDVTDMLNRVSTWPPDKRLSLAQRLLATLEHDLAPQARPRKSLGDLLGLLQQQGPPPTDEECAKILDEERLKKYAS
ncbi:MAG: hypothetical protein K2R98_11170 [Gemmataceae bacterium]|nr:hypothetical protein [Gemmataceae bacterium]